MNGPGRQPIFFTKLQVYVHPLHGECRTRPPTNGRRWVEKRLAGSPTLLRSVIRWGVHGCGITKRGARPAAVGEGEQQLTAALRPLSGNWWIVPDVLPSADGDPLSQIGLVGVGPPASHVRQVQAWGQAVGLSDPVDLFRSVCSRIEMALGHF